MEKEYDKNIFQKLFNEEQTEELSDEMMEEIQEYIKKDSQLKKEKDKKEKLGEVKKISASKNKLTNLNQKDVDKITSTFDSLLKEIKSYSTEQRKTATKNIHNTLSDYVNGNAEVAPKTM